MSRRDELASNHASTTVFTDETGNDEVLIHNMRFMSFGAGFDAAIEEVRKMLLEEGTEAFDELSSGRAMCVKRLLKRLDSLTKDGEE